MEIIVSVRHGKVSEKEKKIAEEKLSAVLETSVTTTKANIIFDQQGKRNIAEFVIKVKGATLEAKEEDFEMHIAVDKALDKIVTQLSKIIDKQKYSSKHQPEGGVQKNNEDEDEDEEVVLNS